MKDAAPPWRSFSSSGPTGSTSPTATDDAIQEGSPSGLTERQEPPSPPSFLARPISWSGDLRTAITLAATATVAALAAGAILGATAVTGLGGHMSLVAPPDPADPVGPSLLHLARPDIGSSAAMTGPAGDGPATAGLVVHVAGAVAVPGLHRLDAGDRVGDAIEAAGGFAPRADLEAAARSLNLAQPLSDGTKVLVPEMGTASTPVQRDDPRVDLNRADQARLESLPGVGPVTAGRIIEARAERRFAKPAELRTRGIVGDSVYGRLKDLVRTGP